MKVLVVVPNYPTAKSASYQFTHQRVKEYRCKFTTDVFSYSKNLNDYVYDEISVYTKKNHNLYTLIKKNNYDRIIFHTINLNTAINIRKKLKNERVIIWFHGTDSISWKRRLDSINFKLSNLYKPIVIAKTIIFPILGWLRKKLIHQLNRMPNLSFVFVSNWHYRTSSQDLQIKYKNYDIIPNYIDSSFYQYKNKTKADRLKVLSITNYANNIYAGDMIQNIIIKFSDYKEFKHFHFTLCGDGKLFNDQTKKIKHLKNITIKKGFLKPEEIKALHQKNGTFLYPKRGDSQGVSRCEAMASGLVSIASDIEAISEFSPKNTTYLVPNNINSFIEKLIYLYNNPDDYLTKSKASTSYIKKICNYDSTIAREIELIENEIKK